MRQQVFYLFTFFYFLLVTISANGQDTLNVMYYNVLNYPNVSNTDPQGNDAARAIAFREIMEEADADVIVMEEMKSNAGASQLLAELNNNTLGKTFGKAPQFFGYGSTTLGNMIFFNTNKMAFVQQTEVPKVNSGTAPNGGNVTAPRPNSHYELEVFSPSNPAEKDTIHFFAGHFKSGQTAGEVFSIPDNERRELSAKDLMDYVTTNLQASDNIIFGGDFNFYSYLPTEEPAYDVLMNPVSYPIPLIDQAGLWIRQNSSASNVAKYTQSTRLASGEYGNGGATSGLDDRFDFILMNEAVDLGLDNVKYIPNTYKSFGSSLMYNSAVTSGSSPVKNQLHVMSDHLPVFLSLELNFSTVCQIANTSITNDNCVSGDYLFDVNFAVGNGSGNYEVVDLTNGNTILATGTSSPISVSLPALNNSTPFDIQVRDVAAPSTCVGEIVTITPINCALVCGITITSITPVCQPDDRYDLEVCFDYQNPTSSEVQVFVDGQVFGPYPYPATSGGCITLPAATLNLLGDATTDLNLRVEDVVQVGAPEGDPFISEIHYNNSSTDVGEFVEVTAPAGTDLSNYLLELYNGSNGTSYNTVGLTGIVPDEGSGCGAVQFLISGIQNEIEGIALVKQNPTISVVEFISYAGTFTATNGNATGLTSTDIGAQEFSSTLIGESIQKTDSAWTGPLAETPNQINAGLTTCGTASNTACFAIATFDEPDCVTPNCSITATTITPTCLANGMYDLEVCFTYQDALSANVNITIDGTTFGPYAYPTTSGGCVTISAASLNLNGDGTTNVPIIIEDALSNAAPAATPYISEIHYDNNSNDVGEFVEISGPVGIDLADYTLYAYEGSDGAFDSMETLAGILTDDGLGCGALAFMLAELNAQFFENGTKDGYALVETATNIVVDFVSFEGVIVASNGPAMGLTSMDISVQESSATAIGSSLKKEDANWVVSTDDSPGVFNAGLTSCGSSGVICMASSLFNEPDCGTSCPTNLTENGATIPTGTYQVSNNISSTGTVSAAANVTFDAGVAIDLDAGFCVPLGAEFMGMIGGCSPLVGEDGN